MTRARVVRLDLRKSGMTLAPVTRLEDILEADWQRQVVQLARQLGWLPYHTFNSRRSAHGFPDLILVRDRLIALELKREKTHATDEQKAWLKALVKADTETYLARPRNLQALADVLAARRVEDGGHLTSPAGRAGREQLLQELREEIELLETSPSLPDGDETDG